MNFNGVLIGSQNPERLVEHYTKLLGDPAMSDGGYTAWQVGSGGLVVGPHDQVKGTNREPGRLILNFESPDVKADFEKWRSAGATVVAEPYNPGVMPDAWVATFSDPDGNYFQLISPMG